ncbi:YbhB/YbcL family Raf kinase inhibitor-like protein [Chitinophaga solisilvae]|uniref:YbhB/YbcL family Raf kinase inhibitor-like protein n=1 Tax=Chitinophaga solisilvae TaxID=1233460 RepID=UPI001367F1DD|nr:YbhB/YbcL family Raf kinase inhibitor-like protein [Chitinophaga solisilvae]
MMTTATTAAALSSQTFTLKSNGLGGQLGIQQYANGMGYNGANQSPQLYWEHAPKGTQCFAVTVYDLDAPTGSGFWHWVVFNIPADIQELPAGAGDPSKRLLPDGAVQSNTDAGIPGYIGAAPNDGPAHRYLITVHALSKKLELDHHATPAIVGFNMHFATLAKASLIVYGQKQ